MSKGFGVFGLLAALLLGFALGAHAGESSPEPGYNLLIEGRLPGAARLHVRVDGSKEDALRMPVGAGGVLSAIRLPPGKPVVLYFLAEDSTGVPRFEGKTEIVVKEGVQAPQVLKLESLLGDAPAELTFASHRLVIEFAGIGEEKNLSTRVTARLFDANGAIVAIKPGDLKWEIDDPWIRENMMPCKGANGPPPACIEFGPIKRGYTDATLLACFQGTICELELFPDPPVWRMVSAGLGHHACALKMDGTAYCWGQGGHGELGAPVAPDCEETFNSEDAGTRPWGCSVVPVKVQCPGGVCNFVDISAGFEHTCAVDAAQDAWCWGGNFIGELGIGTDDEDGIGLPQAQRVSTTQKFIAISAGSHFTCGLTTAHDVFCWGSNRIAVVPHIPDTMLTVPTQVNLQLKADSIDAGWSNVCARTIDMGLYCWGENDLYHTLGSEPPYVTPQCGNCSAFPRRMQFADIPQIDGEDIDLASVGMHGICAHVVMGGRTECWGERVPAMTATGPLDRLTRGGQVYCTLRRGIASCAGQGKMGALGDDSFSYEPFGRGPVTPVGPPFKIREISAGLNFTCAIGQDDRLYCWGDNHLGKLGSGLPETPSAVPVRVSVN